MHGGTYYISFKVHRPWFSTSYYWLNIDPRSDLCCGDFSIPSKVECTSALCDGCITVLHAKETPVSIRIYMHACLNISIMTTYLFINDMVETHIKRCFHFTVFQNTSIQSYRVQKVEIFYKYRGTIMIALYMIVTVLVYHTSLGSHKKEAKFIESDLSKLA